MSLYISPTGNPRQGGPDRGYDESIGLDIDGSVVGPVPGVDGSSYYDYDLLNRPSVSGSGIIIPPMNDGFPKRSESVYDTFGVGHSSTSISAALGMSLAANDSDQQHIAVIGDGAMTAGLAFEGLNHAGVEDTNLIVILNDNCMSIDPAVGALKEYLTDISTSKTYNKARNKIWKILGKISKFGSSAQTVAKKIEGAVKSTILGESNYFESLNF